MAKKTNGRKKGSLSASERKKLSESLKGNKRAVGSVEAVQIRARESVVKRKISKGLVEEYFNIFSSYTIKELQAMQKGGELSALEEMIVSVLIAGITWGDQYKLEYILSRTIGPLERVTDVRVSMNQYAGWTIEQLEAEKRRLSEINRAKLLEWQKSGGGQVIEAKAVNALKEFETKYTNGNGTKKTES